MKKLTTDQFIEKAKVVHGNVYDYSTTIYINSRNLVNITCKTHGEFDQRPHDHLSGVGCPKCGLANRIEKRRLGKTEFIEKAEKIHGTVYDYSNIVYVNWYTNLEIVCKKHGVFLQRPSTHLRGSGCPSCAKSGFDPNKPAILYYLSILNGIAYKIGITNLSVKDRYSNYDLNKIAVLKEWEYAVGEQAYKDEQFYLRVYKEYKYTGKPLLKTGNSELFTKDILNLDSE